jgi:chromodomain-helicase-DNA-binding protein 7
MGLGGIGGVTTGGEGDGTTAAESDGLAQKKKRRYTKKKSIASHLFDEKSNTATMDNDSTTTTTTNSLSLKLLNEAEAEQSNSCMTPDLEFPVSHRAPKGRGGRGGATPGGGGDFDSLTPGSGRGRGGGAGGFGPGRKKSAAHLVNFVKNSKRKKRKKTSSGEEDEADDDSDDAEFQVTPAQKDKNKKESDSQQLASSNDVGGDSTTADPTDCSDEAAAKALQANEKRRSTRAVQSKRQKCSNDGLYVLKDEDLMMPPTAEDFAAAESVAAAEAAAASNSNIVLDSNFIVDKILGHRMFKRKTKRKVEKPPKEKKKEKVEPNESDKKDVDNLEEVKKVDQPAEITSDETSGQSKTADEAKELVVAQDSTVTQSVQVKEAESVAEKLEVNTEVNEKCIENSETDQKPQQMDISDIQATPEKASSQTDTNPKVENAESTSTDAPAPDQIKSEIKSDELVSETKTETKLVASDDSKMELDPTTTDIVKTEAVEAPKVVEDGSEDDDEDEVSEYEEDGGEIEVEEFFVKYKTFSYLHCEWRTRDELLFSDKRVDQKIKRYRLKKSQSATYDWDDGNLDGYAQDNDELFNPDYVEVDRILDVFDMDDPAKPGLTLKYYLVKWKTLPYDESSWELEKDIIETYRKKIDSFYQFNTLVPEVHEKVVAKPGRNKWQEIHHVNRNYKNNMKLREYQLEGINWLTFCWLNSRNCILADEMGLGKTVQSVTFLYEVAQYGIRGPFLVIVPLSTIGNWIREFERWTDFNVIMYHGSAASRQMLQDYEFYFTPDGTLPGVSNSSTKAPASAKKTAKFNALITTFEVILSDVPLFCEFKWRNIIIDEAHRLKNKNCKLIEGLRCIDVEHKVLLTGTPLQNNVEELYSLLNYLEPAQFHSSEEFMQDFGNLQTDTQVSNLQALLKPMMLRRLKEDVEKNLAPKEETIVEVELTNTQKKYYRAILERNFQFLSRGASSSNVPNLMNTMMELRKCCNHPYLITGAEDQIIVEHCEKKQTKSDPKDVRSHDKLILEAMVQASGKLVLVDKLLPKLKAGGHKVLIFSQMIRVLDILEDYLIQMRFAYERIDGRIRGELRQEAIDRYSKPDSDRFAFLLCTRAGGLGINLTAADTVIIYDSDWNPQNDLQAQARCHRIGQQKSVKIYRLITRNTYEREMFDKASLKLGLDKALLQGMRNEDKFNKKDKDANTNNFQLTKKEIEDLLKKGAYGALMEDDTAADKFCEEDIDNILSKRSTVIQIEGGEKGSTFSKASFQSTDTNEISIDDPEFWQKWAKKADIDVEEKLNPKDERIIYEPRRRTQTRRFDGGEKAELLESDYSSDNNSTDADNDQNKDPNGGGLNNGEKMGKDGKKRGKKSKRLKAEFNPNLDTDWNGGSNDAFYEEGGAGVWSRDECYKVEKNLLIFGWSRWSKILKHCEFSARKKGGVQNEQDVENLSRTIIAYALKNYHGDESIKQFVIELIDPSKSNFADLKNHCGLAAPVGRSKKAKSKSSSIKVEEKSSEKANVNDDAEMMPVKDDEELKEEKLDDIVKDEIKTDVKSENVVKEEKDSKESLDVDVTGELSGKKDSVEEKKPKKEPKQEDQTTTSNETDPPNQLVSDLYPEWAKNAEELLGDDNYKKHLIRQANRILLRLRQLFYIKHEIIGDENAAQIDKEELTSSTTSEEDGTTQSPPLPIPNVLIPEVLGDLPADWWVKSCDSSRFVGVYKHGYEKYSLMRLDPQLCFLQICGPPDAQDLLAEQQQQQDEANDDKINEPNGDIDEAPPETTTKGNSNKKGKKKPTNNNSGYQKFPTVSELNNRLRRLIASVQKYKKQEVLMSKRNAERQEKRMSKLV